ncbi:MULTISPECIES: MerR family transcriptional regulator [Tahibacter]|jgi:MerR family mercuric resistance operon transcriptional regulator|uniref:MerR family transcriptional regulator n=1 Tax=Tahibacter amnicola TaxID=2976241 RepID=A0ABY6B7M6_9GAMM|nr:MULTISPECIES: MerR family transcriptional regulator [Tahibacter]UXI66098.1 MerR family transcriptional regulator [Tahibacter amnicola]
MDDKTPASLDASGAAAAPSTKGPMRIGELASASGVPVDTVRYYERIGLLPTPARRGGGYRKYEPDDVYRLQAIRGAKALGLTLEAIRTLLVMALPSARPAPVRACAKALQQELADRCAALQSLAVAVDTCRRGPPPTLAACPILATLHAYACAHETSGSVLLDT